MELKMKLLSALDKVFLDAEPVERPENGVVSGFRNEVISFQAAYSLTDESVAYVEAEVVSPIQ